MANPSDEQQWKDQWKKAFEEAEVTPSPQTWKGIEHQLALQEGLKYRRGFLVYRGIAAALLMLLGGLSWYVLSHRDGVESLAIKSESGSVPTEDSVPYPDRSVAAEDRNNANDVVPADRSAKASTDSPRVAPSLPSGPTAINQATARRPRGNEASSPDASTAHAANPSQRIATLPPSLLPPVASTKATDRSTNGIALVTSYPAAGSPSQLSPVSPVLYRVPEPGAADQQKQPSQPTFFAGLTLAPGYFDPQFEAPAPNLAVAGPSIPAAAPGVQDLSRSENATFAPSPAASVDDEQALSFSYGLDVGMRLSDHWVIESGVDYSRFSTTSETRWAIADVASGQRYPYLAANRSALNYGLNANASPARVAATPVDNAYEFIALPLKIGYRRTIDRLQFTVSSGVAANFFLGNSISAIGEGFGDYRLSANDAGSPFRSLYYSGVVSGGVNYNVLGSYFLSLTPSYSFALTGLTREESDISSQPRSFGINLGIEYQF